ncbi:MAG TPA: type II secretion system protein GspK [Pseudolabrys sp.]|nr:type II secretion system protein GspK [Pseudolabrys sp.]
MLARTNLQIVDTKTLVEAAVSRAVLAMLESNPDRYWRTDGVARRFEFAESEMTISIQDELGLIDLNQADPSILISLMQTAGLDRQSADKLVDKILDWRDPKPTRRLNGAEESDYQTAGSSYRPRKGPFQSVDELLMVMDMTPTLFERIESAVTVYSGRHFVDPNVAPREVLLALPNADATSVETIIATRTSQNSQINALAAGNVIPLRGRVFTIRTEFEKLKKRVSHRVTIRLTDDPSHPYWILNWRIR